MDVNKIKMTDLLKETNLVLPITELLECITDEKLHDLVKECIFEMDIQDVMSFLIKFDKHIDKAKLTFINYLYSEKIVPINDFDLEEEPLEHVQRMQRLKKIMEDNPSMYVYLDQKTLNTITYDSRDYASLKQREQHVQEKKEAKERCKEIESELDFAYLSSIHVLSDFDIYSKNDELTDFFKEKIVIEANKSKFMNDRETLSKILREEIESDILYVDYLPHFEKVLKDYPEYINWDKFLLLSAYRAKEILDDDYLEDLSDDEEETLIKIIETSKKLIKNQNTKISGNINFYGYDVKRVNYSVSNLERDASKIINGHYYGKRKVAELLKGKLTLKDIENPSILKLVNLSSTDKKEYAKQNPMNSVELYKRGLISDKELKSYLSELPLDNSTIEELLSLEGKPIKEDSIIELYLKGNINLEVLIQYKKEIEQFIDEEQLVNYYQTRNDKDSKEKAEKYFALYRELKLTNKDEMMRTELGENIILELGEKMEAEDFVELYRRNLITIDNVVEWNGEDFVTQMIAHGQLKPIDSKKLISEHKINIEQIKRILTRKELSDEEKISFIITTFDGDENADIRFELFQTLGVTENNRNPKQERFGTKQRNIAGATTPNNVYEMDPSLKMSLLLKIDKDYTYSITRDGHMVLELPKLNKVIIEKLFKRSKEKVEFATGTATYILDLDQLYISDIISDDKKINRPVLYELNRDGIADRLYHTKNWGKMIKDAFNISESERYTTEDRKEIDKLIEKIEKNRKLREF